MNQKRVFVSAGVLLILIATLATASFLILQSVPGFNQILRTSPGEALEIFNNHQTTVIVGSYLLVIVGLILLPLVQSMHHAIKLQTNSSVGLSIIKTFGIAAAIFQIIGSIGWVTLVPSLASNFFDAGASVAGRDGAVLAYDSFSRMFGLGVGGHLGVLFFGIWILGIAIVQVKSPIFKQFVAVIGVLTAIGLVIASYGTLGDYRTPNLTIIGTITNIAVSLWMVISAVFLFRNSENTGLVNPPEYSDHDGSVRADGNIDSTTGRRPDQGMGPN